MKDFLLNRNVYFFLILVASILLLHCSKDETPVNVNPAEIGLFDKTLLHDNEQREYLLYIPESYTGDDAYPMVISLHGAGGTKEGHYELSEFNQLADTAHFILVTAEATAAIGNLHVWNQQSSPNGADDVGFINALIDEIDREYNVDVDRIYIAGSSNGAFMALEITCKLSEKIAAAVAVKGYMSPDQIQMCTPTKPTSILQIHGTQDPLVPYSGVEATVQFWINTNQTDRTPSTQTLPDTDPSNGNMVIRTRYSGGQNGVEVEHLQVINGVHDWFGEPGTNYDIHASTEAWAFFKRFTLNGIR